MILIAHKILEIGKEGKRFDVNQIFVYPITRCRDCKSEGNEFKKIFHKSDCKTPIIDIVIGMNVRAAIKSHASKNGPDAKIALIGISLNEFNNLFPNFPEIQRNVTPSI